MTNIPFTIADHSITFFAKGQPHHIGRDNPNFEAARERLLTSTADIDQLIGWCDSGEALRTVSQGRFEVTYDSVLYKGNRIDNYFTEKLLKLQAENVPFQPLLNVLESLYRNPTNSARTRFPIFAQVNDLPWLADGRMTALKVVRDNFTDVHSGKFDNSVGKVVEIDRGDVDDNPDNTCSYGLHLGAYRYIPNFGLWQDDRRVVLCAFWPEDVVSVPTDYDGSKMRVCKYEVLEEISKSYIDEFVRKHQNTVATYDSPNADVIDTGTVDVGSDDYDDFE